MPTLPPGATSAPRPSSPVSSSRRSLLLAAAAAGFAPRASAQDQSWPSRPLRIVVPFAPGGTTDLIARVVGVPMSDILGQSVVVENRPGAGGLLGADAVAKAAADGYTVLMANISYPLAVLVAERAKRLQFAPIDLKSVTEVASVPLIITAPPSLPVNDLKGFAELLRKDTATHHTFGSTGPGSYMHAFGEWFKQQTGVAMTHVPYKGAAPLKLEVLAGRVSIGGDQISSSLAEVRAGTLKALAITSPQRSKALPDVATVTEQGFPGMETEGWNGLLAPAATPAAIVSRIQEAVAKAVQLPAVSKRLLELAAEPRASEPAQFDGLLKRQFEQFRPIVAKLSID